jgi:arylsulfatase A-like enzyme
MDAELGVLAIDPSDTDCGAVNDIVTGAKVTRQALLLLDQAKESGKPFFLFVHYFDPHDSYIPPAPYNLKYDPEYKGKIDGRNVVSYRTNLPGKEDINHLISLYDGEISYSDNQVGELLKKIDEVSDPAGTIVIFVADHGEAFGEHGSLLHGNYPYMEEVSVPMIWRWSGVLPKGKRVKSSVLSLDISRTLNELLGIKGMELNQGQSLWPGLMGKEMPGERLIFSDRANRAPYHVAVLDDHYRFHTKFKNEFDIHSGEYEFYDISTDRWEQKNLITTESNRCDMLKKAIEKMWTEGLEMRKYFQEENTEKEANLTQAERDRLKSLGYIGGAGSK